MSWSERIGTWISSSTSVSGDGLELPVQVAHALFQIERGCDVFERQSQLDHGERDLGPDPDDHRFSAAQPDHVRQVCRMCEANESITSIAVTSTMTPRDRQRTTSRTSAVRRPRRSTSGTAACSVAMRTDAVRPGAPAPELHDSRLFEAWANLPRGPPRGQMRSNCCFWNRVNT